jgi:hypothetical protein
LDKSNSARTRALSIPSCVADTASLTAYSVVTVARRSVISEFSFRSSAHRARLAVTRSKDRAIDHLD